MNRHFSKEDTQMASKWMERCSTSLVMKEMHIRTTVWYHLACIRMAAEGWQGGGTAHYAVVQSLSRVWLSVTPWAVACQAPLCMEFSRQEYWSGLSFPPPGSLPHPRIEPVTLASPALAGGFFTTRPPGKPDVHCGDRVNSYTTGRKTGWQLLEKWKIELS